MEYNIAIVGGGPRCTYALERLAALLPKTILPAKLRISIFERTGRFGAGEAHSDTQPVTNYLNRVAGQVAFAADESNCDSSKLLPKPMRLNLSEWCQAKYTETGDERFNLLPQDIPKRYIHGLALRDMFQRYVMLLRTIEGVTVDLYVSNVTDVSRHTDTEAPYRIHVGGTSGFSVPANYILFVTGHSHNHPDVHSTAAKLVSYNEVMPGARYVPYAYPLEEQVTEETVPPGCVVVVHGLGLTAIDIFLYLTEGRGGAFIPIGQAGPLSKLRYLPSGREPASMVGISPSGIVYSCRPDNAKEADVATLEHKGVFFTIAAVRSLRRTFGRPVTLANYQRRCQLDFEKHIFPLVVLEMAYVYYKTLFGEKYGDYIRCNAEPRYRHFLREGCSSRDAGVEYVLEPVQACFGEVAAYVSRTAGGAPISGDLRKFEKMNVLQSFLSTLFGGSLEVKEDGFDETWRNQSNVRNLVSPWGHSSDVYDHRFEWRTIFDPLSADDAVSGTEWRARTIAYMEKDLANAAQNNLRNPLKAACDGVWRDLRPVLSEAVDRGGLLPDSHRCFISKYLRYYNRLSNGAGLEPMRKILALIECGLLDISLGPSPVIEPSLGNPPFRIIGPRTGVIREADVIVDGKLHPFDAELDANPLYPNLLRRGLVRKWYNPGQSPSDDFFPGGLDLTDKFHPIRPDGTVDTQLTFLGSPADRVLFFQLAAARPNSNSGVLNCVANWADELLEAILESGQRTEAAMGDESFMPITGHSKQQASTGCALTTMRNPAASRDEEILAPSLQTPTITGFRSRIRSVLEREANALHSRHIVILGIDGIPYDLALKWWSHATSSKMRSVFPTTSSTAWLSSLSGMSVDSHGVPGVVFRVPDRDGDLINIFEYRGEILRLEIENIFSDAARFGYVPLSVLGDLEDFDCSWRDLLLQHSQKVHGYRFYTGRGVGYAPLDPVILCRHIQRAVLQSLQPYSQLSPCLLWCFIDIDRHIHHCGYDEHVIRFLELIDQAAVELTQRNAIVIAHSDHGLTRTSHETQIEQLIEQLKAQHQCSVGGAGRTRWIYSQADAEQKITDQLVHHLPPSIRIGHADDFFSKGSLSRGRVGNILLIAQREGFLTSDGYSFDHGSLTDSEVDVPFAEWRS